MSTIENRSEKSVRRALAREGLLLATRRGGRMVLDAESRAVVGGASPAPYSLTLDQAAEYVDWYRSA